MVITLERDRQDLITLNRLDELLKLKQTESGVKVAAITRSTWRGLYRSVQRYVSECTDCETGKGRPVINGESPGNLQATYPFQIIAMDHIPSLPRSFKGNTELLIWVDLFSGYVVAKASKSRTAQTIAENYEECVIQQFGASEAIRHDREPGFMSIFFVRSIDLLGKSKGQRWHIALKRMGLRNVWCKL